MTDTEHLTAATERGRRETAALRLLRDGYTAGQARHKTGVPLDRLRELLAEQPPVAAAPCPEPKCGRPQDGPGHPRKGWVQVKVAGQTADWFCGWRCVALHARKRLAGAA